MKKVILIIMTLVFVVGSFVTVRADELVETAAETDTENEKRETVETIAGETVDDPLSIRSKSVLLMELESGTVLYEKNADEMLRPASVTKIMTLLLIFEALERGDITLEDTVVVTEHAASMGGSQCFFEAGEEQTVQDMIKCIEVASGNDAAVAMAEHLAGSETAFVQKMNDRAKELGMEHTHFDNACGLEVETHLTSARDIAIMSRQLLLYHPDILTYSTIWMDSITHKTRRGESRFDLANTNKFLNLYTGANGLKTGYTSQAKYCMSATATRDGVTLIAVVMGADTKEIRNSEAMKLLDYGFAQCRSYVDMDVLPETLYIPVQKGTSKSVAVKPVEQHTITLAAINPDQIEKQVIAYENLKAPIREGDAVGVVQYLYNGNCISEVVLYAEQTVPKLDMKYSLAEIAGRIFMAK